MTNYEKRVAKAGAKFAKLLNRWTDVAEDSLDRRAENIADEFDLKVSKVKYDILDAAYGC